MVIQLIHFWPTELFQNKRSLGKCVIRGHLPIVSANGKFVNTAFLFIDQAGNIYIYLGMAVFFRNWSWNLSDWCVKEVGGSIWGILLCFS